MAPVLEDFVWLLPPWPVGFTLVDVGELDLVDVDELDLLDDEVLDIGTSGGTDPMASGRPPADLAIAESNLPSA